MKRSAEETAVLVAVLLKRSEQRRARISDKTIRRLAKRRTLRDVFKEKLREELDDIGIHLVELERGGFGVLPINALDGAPAITAKRYIPEEIKKLSKGDDRLFEKLRTEIGDDAEGAEEFDE